MKTKATMKVTNVYDHVIAIGYCGAQFLLRFQNPTFYNAGVYGWNNDIYTNLPNDTCIVTGYRNLRGIHPDYDLLKEYENQAERIACDWDIPYEERVEKVNDLLKQFILTVTA